MSALEDHLETRMKQCGLPEMERNYRFVAHHVGLGKGIRQRIKEIGLKDWQIDFADLNNKIAIEIEGGTWGKPVTCDKCGSPVHKYSKNRKRVRIIDSGGGHTRGKYYEDNCKKYNAAQIMGWRVYRFTTDMIKNDEAVLFLMEVYGMK